VGASGCPPAGGGIHSGSGTTLGRGIPSAPSWWVPRPADHRAARGAAGSGGYAPATHRAAGRCGQGPDDACAVDPTAVGCQDHQSEDPPGTHPGSGGGDWCGPYNGTPVPCVDDDLGFWAGTPEIIYGYYTLGGGGRAAGCGAGRGVRTRWC
jgi:hypothetical protein